MSNTYYNPKVINVSELPSSLITNRGSLPSVASVYLVIDTSGKVRYVGQAKDLRRRWSAHNKAYEFGLLGVGVRVAWIEISDTALLSEIEKALIRHFLPDLNVRHKKLLIKRAKRMLVAKQNEVEDVISVVNLREFSPEKIKQLPTVTARQEGATELRIFLLKEEKELVKQVVAKKSITLSHLVRQLLLAWASEQNNNESKAS